MYIATIQSFKTLEAQLKTNTPTIEQPYRFIIVLWDDGDDDSFKGYNILLTLLERETWDNAKTGPVLILSLSSTMTLAAMVPQNTKLLQLEIQKCTWHSVMFPDLTVRTSL